MTFTYLDAPNNGDVDVTGYTVPVNARTMETIGYAGDANDNDLITVVDNNDPVDPARIAPTADGATYTRNGGVSATEVGPDLTEDQGIIERVVRQHAQQAAVEAGPGGEDARGIVDGALVDLPNSLRRLRDALFDA